MLIHGFKNYCALLFHKGALLSDPEKILVQQTENVQAARQMRFTNLDEVKKQEKIIREYIYEAIETEKQGLKVKMKKTSEYEIPHELQKVLDENAALKAAFESLTPGRQRGYLFYFSQAKQAKTRESRIQKCIPKIFDGKGYDER